MVDKTKLKQVAQQAATRHEARQERMKRKQMEKIHAQTDWFLAALPDELEKNGEARYHLPDHCRSLEQLPEAAKYLADVCREMGLQVEVDRECDQVGYSVRCTSDLVVRDGSRPAKK